MTDNEPPKAPNFVAPIKEQHRDLTKTRAVLRDWLAARLPDARDLALSAVQTPEGTGVANETIFFDGTWTTGKTRHSQGFVARLAAKDPLYFAANIETHYKMYAALAGLPGIPVPRVYGYEADRGFLGTPFFVMEKIDGLIPPDRPHYTLEGWLAEATVDERRALWYDAVNVMARLHKVDPQRTAFLDRPQDGASGLEQELAYWRGYLTWSEAGRPHDVLETGLAWLCDNMPQHRPKALSWGDSRISNMIFRDFRCVAVLDWDSVSLIGGEADLAWWIVMGHNTPGRLDGLGTPRETINLWQELTGWRANDLHYYLVFTAFRLGTIVMRLAQQMAARGLLTADTADLETNNGPIQQVALFLGLTPPGPVTATLPNLDE